MQPVCRSVNVAPLIKWYLEPGELAGLQSCFGDPGGARCSTPRHVSILQVRQLKPDRGDRENRDGTPKVNGDLVF